MNYKKMSLLLLIITIIIVSLISCRLNEDGSNEEVVVNENIEIEVTNDFNKFKEDLKNNNIEVEDELIEEVFKKIFASEKEVVDQDGIAKHVKELKHIDFYNSHIDSNNIFNNVKSIISSFYPEVENYETGRVIAQQVTKRDLQYFQSRCFEYSMDLIVEEGDIYIESSVHSSDGTKLTAQYAGLIKYDTGDIQVYKKEK